MLEPNEDPGEKSPLNDDMILYAKIGLYAVPVVVVHVFVIGFLLRVMTGFTLPSILHSDLVVAWLWINGALLGLAVYCWKTGRLPGFIGASRFRVRLAIISCIAISLGSFMLPTLLGDIARRIWFPIGW